MKIFIRFGVTQADLSLYWAQMPIHCFVIVRLKICLERFPLPLGAWDGLRCHLFWHSLSLPYNYFTMCTSAHCPPTGDCLLTECLGRCNNTSSSMVLEHLIWIGNTFSLLHQNLKMLISAVQVFLSLEVCANWVEILSSIFEDILKKKLSALCGEKSKYGSTYKLNIYEGH